MSTDELLKTFANYDLSDEVQLIKATKEKILAPLLEKNEDKYYPVNVSEKMKSLINVGDLLAIAWAGTMDQKSWKSVTGIVFDYQRLVKDSLLTCKEFVIKSTDALKNMQIGLSIITSEEAKDPKQKKELIQAGLDFIFKCQEYAEEMVATCQTMIDASDKLCKLAKEACEVAVEDKTASTEKRDKLVAEIKALQAKQAKVTSLVNALNDQIQQQNKMIDDYISRADSAESHSFTLALVSALVKPVTEIAHSLIMGRNMMMAKEGLEAFSGKKGSDDSDKADTDQQGGGNESEIDKKKKELDGVTDTDDQAKEKKEKLQKELDELISQALPDEVKIKVEEKKEELAGITTTDEESAKRKVQLQHEIDNLIAEAIKSPEKKQHEIQVKIDEKKKELEGITSTDDASKEKKEKLQKEIDALNEDLKKAKIPTSIPADTESKIEAKKKELNNIKSTDEESQKKKDKLSKEIDKMSTDLKDVTAQMSQSQLEFAKNYQNMAAHAIEIREELQKNLREQNAELAESVKKVEGFTEEKDYLSEAITSLGIAIQALGQIKTCFENVRLMWAGIQSQCKSLMQNKALETLKICPISLLQKSIAELTVTWISVGRINITALSVIKDASNEIDNFANTLPSNKEEAKATIAKYSAKVLNLLKQYSAEKH